MQEPGLVFLPVYWAKYRRHLNRNGSEPKESQTLSSNIAEIMERSSRSLIKTTQQAYPSVFCRSSDESWSIPTQDTHTHTQQCYQCVLRYTTRPT